MQGPGSLKAFGLLAVLFSLVGKAALAGGLTFALVVKNVEDVNFIDAWRGCSAEAKRHGDSCLLIGGPEGSAPHFQANAIKEALKTNRFKAMAVSVSSSEMVADAVKSAQIPIITFDSPFAPREQHLSRAYIGTDNVEMGRELARLAKRFRPRGGSIMLMTAAHDPNHAERVQGVRQELSGDARWPEGSQLNGENGWSELPRSPWNSGDRAERAADELNTTLKHLRPDVFISVGHWPVLDTQAYRRIVGPFTEDLVTQKRIVLAAVGRVSQDTHDLLKESLVHGFVCIDFYAMGKVCYRKMKLAAEGQPIPPVINLPNVICTAK